MKRDNKKKPQKLKKDSPAIPVMMEEKKKVSPGIWMLLIAGTVAFFFSPMLNNGFTNWDDENYIVANLLLRGPDWKGIFTQEVVGNYHPLTILSLSLNYYLTELNPFSYILFNLLLHVANTLLVFYFIWIISEKKIWVALFTALLFGLHPMHVESVAWISERKDVLYTLFFLFALIKYWHYLKSGKILNYWLCFIFFVLSIASKPAAIVLPLVLFLLDYWKGRPYNKKIIIEKIPFFLVSMVFAGITLFIQSKTAVASLDVYPLWSRMLFACYVVMIYFLRFIIPYPLSAFHPYPDPGNLGTAVLLSPFFALALIAFIWVNRKNKLVVFSILFFIVNLLLVMQVVSIGYTIVSERYTYVP